MRSEVSKRILSETSDERKQKVRESTNELLKTMKEAKDKAEELIEKFSYETFKNNDIQCALICVDEIINLLDDEGYGNDYIIKFYKQVKQEILNRQ